MPPPTLLSFSDELLSRIYLHLLNTPHLTRTLHGRSLTDSEPAFALASTCTRLRALFGTAIRALAIDWDTPVYLNTLAHLFGPTLTTLSIRGHARADFFLAALAALAPSPLTALSLSNCPAPTQPLYTLVATGPPLRTLHLRYVITPDFAHLVETLSPHLAHLSTLSIEGSSELTHSALVAACTAPGPNLHTLSLRYLRHTSISAETLSAITKACPAVTSLFLDDIRHAPRAAVAEMVSAYAPNLSALHLHSCRLSPDLLCDLLQTCDRLEELGVEEAEWSTAQAGIVIDKLIAIPAHLRKLHVRDVRGLLDSDVRRIAAAWPRLESVALRRHELLTDAALFHISCVGETLLVLDVRGCFVTDDGLRSIGRDCSKLEGLYLGGDGQDLSEEGARRVGPVAVTNEGIDGMLAGCGASLEEFVWDTPFCLRRSPTGRDYRVPIGVMILAAEGIARSLAAHCPNLLRVEVKGLRPAARELVNKARYDLAFIELEEAVEHVEVFLDNWRPAVI